MVTVLVNPICHIIVMVIRFCMVVSTLVVVVFGVAAYVETVGIAMSGVMVVVPVVVVNCFGHDCW